MLSLGSATVFLEDLLSDIRILRGNFLIDVLLGMAGPTVF